MSAHMIDVVRAEPKLVGVHGRAWMIFPEVKMVEGQPHIVTPEPNDPMLAGWLVECPNAHPLWHSYLLSLITLKEIPGIRPPTIHLEGATHELLVFALHPDCDRNKLLRESMVNASETMAPPNFAAQFIDSDINAMLRVERAVELIVRGLLSPDSDNIRQWITLFNDSMVRK